MPAKGENWWAGERWAMDSHALNAVVSADPSALFGRERQEASRGYAVQDGVAVIELKGMLANRLGFFAFLFGGSSYTGFSAAVERADADPQVRSLRIDVDSPGGAVTGVEAAAASLAMCHKPTAVSVDGLCCSAAYWIASQADSIEATKTSRVGNIGTIISILDTRKRDEAAGIVRHQFISSQ